MICWGGCNETHRDSKWELLEGPKKNKPSEMLFHVEEICSKCHRVLKIAYVSEHELSEEQKINLGYYEAKGQIK